MYKRFMKKSLGLALSFLILVIIYQNCSQPPGGEISSASLSSSVGKSTTANQNSDSISNELCHRWVIGNDSNGIPTWGDIKGKCDGSGMPLLFSVTHENECNTHLACKKYPNDLNYKENIKAYMADYKPQDIGTWIKYGASGNRDSNLIGLSIDTINYADMINVTGRPVSEGYTFFGFADLSLVGIANLTDELIVEFEYNTHIS